MKVYIGLPYEMTQVTDIKSGYGTLSLEILLGNGFICVFMHRDYLVHY